MTWVPDTCHIGARRIENPAAALFDVDGTLVDSMGRFFPSWNEAGADYGLSMTEAEFYGYAGMPLPDIVEDLYRRCKGTEPPDGFVAEFLASKKAKHAAREAITGPPPVIACVAAIARAWAARGVPVVCATSGLRDHVEPHLAAAGLSDLFPSDKIVCAADLPKGRGKPLPDIFLRAAAVAGVDASHCVAYEDAEAGLKSAWAAGCAVVDVTGLPDYPLPEGLRAAKAAQVQRRDWLPPSRILVTGGTRGIGRAVVEALARRELPDFLRFPGLAASGAEFVPPRFCEMFYFNAEQGRGVPTHLDSNCGASWVMQIRGVKRWTLWPPEPKNSSRADTWHFAREYETVLQPGDVIVFHPGWWHKTVQESETPSLSLNMYLPEPLPLFFLREFDEVLVKQGRTDHCTAMWRLEARAGFGVSGVGQSVAETIWRVLDSLAEALVRAW